MYTAWCIFILTFTTEFCSNSHDFHTETAEETATEPLGAKRLGRWQSKMHPNQLHLYQAINIRSSNYSVIYIFNNIIASFFGEIHPIVFGTSLSGLSWEPWGSVVASVAWVGVEKPLRDRKDSARVSWNSGTQWPNDGDLMTFAGPNNSSKTATRCPKKLLG